MQSYKNTGVFAWLIVGLFLSGCVSAPIDYPKSPSSALIDTDDTALAKSSASWRAADPERNGFYPLSQGMDAFGARLVLMDRAERSIDAQYFLMKPDAAGLVFGGKLLEAADRGVRVRFLLDDIFSTVDDSALIVLNKHPNIELRIFNPIAREGSAAVNYLGHFSLTNRRMHNKSFTVDNQLSIVGGRNIAKEYFQLDTSGEFIDFDMLCAGPITKDISAHFDTYWNHELAVPMDAFYDQTDSAEVEDARNRIEQAMQDTGQSTYASAIHTELIQKLLGGSLQPYIADARMIVDDPNKLLEKVSDEQKIVATEIVQAFERAESEILIFTPYFIPGKDGIELFRSLIDKGIRIVVLTNSLATNNHTSVHSSYSSYRKRLLQAGVELWEARVDAARTVRDDGSVELEHLTLHTKGIIIDRRYTFVGSLNLDPRSIDINTEMGVMIDSRDLAISLADNAERRIPGLAYQLKLDDKNKISWHATIDGQQVVETREPQTSGWRRFQAWFLKIAPEKQL
jgi:putative cardiolipin synthase